MSHRICIFTAVLALALPAAAETALKCEQFTPRARTIKISRMESLRRGKAWLEGPAKSVAAVSCDQRGMKTEETEYDGKALRLRTVYTYLEGDGAKAACEKLRSEEKLTTTFSGEARSSLDDFCRANKKKDYGVAQVYDRSPSGAATAQDREDQEKPVRRIFRVFDPKGFPVEEYAFDPLLSLETRTSHVYDKANNLTETAVSDPEGRQLSREATARDKVTGSRTVSVYGENNELAKKTVYEYREDGTLRREVRTSYDAGGQALERSELYCDGKGNYQKELVYDGDAPEAAREFNYEHAFDKAGNWTLRRRSRIILYNGNRMADTQYAPEITRRDIEYYK